MSYFLSVAAALRKLAKSLAAVSLVLHQVGGRISGIYVEQLRREHVDISDQFAEYTHAELSMMVVSTESFRWIDLLLAAEAGGGILPGQLK